MESEGLKASVWIAIFAGVIALLALCTTIWQLVLTRRHNHLSARPILDIDIHGRDSGLIGIHLKNCGPGPALLHSLSATYRKVQYNLFKQTDFRSFIGHLLREGVVHQRSSFVVTAEGTVIAPGQTLELF